MTRPPRPPGPARPPGPDPESPRPPGGRPERAGPAGRQISPGRPGFLAVAGDPGGAGVAPHTTIRTTAGSRVQLCASPSNDVAQGQLDARRREFSAWWLPEEGYAFRTAQVTRRYWLIWILVSALGADPVCAQTLGELAARDAFLMAPSVALPPFGPAIGGRRYGAQVAVRLDDGAARLPVNFGLSTAAPLPRLGRGGSFAATLMYLSGGCDGCNPWLGGRVDAQRSLIGAASARLSIGRAFRTGNRGASTSIAFLAPLRFGGPTMTASLVPGIAVAGVSTDQQRSRALRATIGGAVQRDYPALTVRVSLQLVLANRGPAIVAADLVRPR